MSSLDKHQSNEFTKLDPVDLAIHFGRPILVNEHGCWLWLGATDRYGYGRKGGILVHGVVWRMTGRSCPQGEELCHTCQSKNCINPDHIYSGTHQQNMSDAARDNVMKGPRRCTDQDYETIGNLLLLGWPKVEIARLVGVSKPLITKFVRGDIKHAQLSKSSK